MKSLIWDYKAKKLLECQELELDINLNPQIAWGIHIHRSSRDFYKLKLVLDFSYFSYVQEWLDSTTNYSLVVDYKRDLHLTTDLVFKGCLPESVNIGDTMIEMTIMCDTYHPLPFREILEVHRDLMISEILSN